MRNNKGVTLISLLSSLLIITLLISITVVTSMNTYNKMKFEGKKAELEEVQKLVDQLASDYQTWLKEQVPGETNISYSDYFNSRYNIKFESEKFETKLLSAHTDAITALMSIPEIEAAVNPSAPSTTAFYFTSNDLVKYFGLKGIDPVVVDFSTRIVYSVKGIKDYNDDTKIYYTPADWGADLVINKNASEKSFSVSARKVSNDGNIFNVIIEIDPVIKSSVSEVYYKKNDNYIKINEFYDLSTSAKTIINAIVNEQGTFGFRVVDSMNNNYDTAVGNNIVLDANEP